MSILNEVVINEIKEIVQKEVKKGANQFKLEDAKIIAQVLLPEIDRIITSKVNKMARRLATDIISWDLVNEQQEQPVKNSRGRRKKIPAVAAAGTEGQSNLAEPKPEVKLVDSGNATHPEPVSEDPANF